MKTRPRTSTNKRNNTRITVRLSEENLNKFLSWQKAFATMSAYMNHILIIYYKENERDSW